MEYGVIIIGAGQAGLSTALSLRKRKYSGSILLIGEEKYPPYQRPPLSKKFLSSNIENKKLFFKSKDFLDRQNIKVLTNTCVSQINKDSKTIVLMDDSEFSYENLVISTGSSLKKMPSSSNKNIYYLRTIDDAINIKNSIKESKEIVVVGGGFIGLEIASVAIDQNIKVTVIEMEDRLMKRSLSNSMAIFLQKKHSSKGVIFKFNTPIKDIIDYQGRKRIICSNGELIDADAVIVGIGVEPNIGLATQSKLECMDGIKVDKNGKTSNENIFAAGDCSSHPNSIFGIRIRLESVHNAIEQGKTVAASITGLSEPYNQTPWFWSDQYNLKLKIAGLIRDYNAECIIGRREDEKFAIFFLKNRQLIAVEAINNQKAFLKGRKLITEQMKIPRAVIKQGNKYMANWILEK